ncbi:MAG TPA: DUF2461 domain-containing protein [Candidatus Kapabacteria bacterium]|nr:DUF2461 domain-containing protein [Candidatus Kapabacteria bacterium]
MATKKTAKPKITLDMAAPVEPFEGYSDKTFKFLHGLKKNNNKPWFEAHRADYETYLREPSKALVGAMAQVFAEEKIPLVSDLRRSLFRINRDIRFSKDKSPYKTHIGIVFGLPDLGADEWAGMYMGFDPKGTNDVSVYFGGGIHMPSPPYLKSVRERIAKDYKRFAQINAAKSFRKEYSKGVTGDSLTRMPKGYDEDHPGATFLKFKDFMYSTSLTKKEICSPSLPKTLLAKIKPALPMLLFLSGKE